MDDGTKHSIHEEKRRIVGSPKTWGSVAFIYRSAKPRNPFGPSHLRWPHVTHSTSSHGPSRTPGHGRMIHVSPDGIDAVYFESS